MSRSPRQVPPHIQKFLEVHRERERRKPSVLPFFILLFCCFCAYLIYGSLNPLFPLPQEPPRFYSNQCQTDLRLLFTRAIDHAQRSIHLVMFGLTDPAVLRSIRERLHQGVATTVYYDPKASTKIPTKLRGAHLVPVQQGGLMHQKILVLDQELVFLGSANMTSAGLRMHDNLVIGFRSPAIAHFLREHPPYTQGSMRTMVGGQDLELWLLPDPRGHVINDLRRMIRNTAHSVKIALFTFTHPGLCEELILARRRGLSVTVVIDQHSALGASAKIVDQLKNANIPIYLSRGVQLLHHKFMVLDDQMLVCGSANWTKAAFYKNSDAILVVHQLNADQRKFMRKLWNRVVYEAALAQKERPRYW